MADFITFMVGLIIFVAVVLILPVFMLVSWQCKGYQEATGKETQMKSGMCFVKDNNVWYNWEEYKYRLATKGNM